MPKRIISLSRTLLLLAALTTSAVAQAQQQTLPGLGDPKSPLEIEADNGLELFQERNLVVAKGNVVAKQGPMVLRSDILSASYEDSPEGQRRIRRIDAVGNVRIETAKERLFGDHVTYDLVRELMVVTGEGLRIEAQNQTIKADKSLEFWGTEQRAVARGNAQVSQDTTTLRADVIEAILAKRNGKKSSTPKKAPAKTAGLPIAGAALTSGNTSLERIRAWGNVMITTATEIVEGDQGDYDVPNQIATLTGNVQITRGKNKLSGEQAIVNLKTGVSRLTGGKTGRVRTIIFPGGSADSGAKTSSSAKPKTDSIAKIIPKASDTPASSPLADTTKTLKPIAEPAQDASTAVQAAIAPAAKIPDTSAPVVIPPAAPAALRAKAPEVSTDQPASTSSTSSLSIPAPPVTGVITAPIPPVRGGTIPNTVISASTIPAAAAAVTNDASAKPDAFGAPVPPPRKHLATSDGLLPRPRPQGAL